MSSVCFAPFIAVAFLGQALPDEAEVAAFFGQAFGKEYAITMSYGAIRKTPDWTDDAENPPISAKKAAKLATAIKDSLAKDNKEPKWELTSLSLLKFEGKWVWLATFTPENEVPLFEPRQATDLHDNFPQLTLPVLMDGTVLRPKFKEK
jgi:hypothetical protein